MDLKDQKVTLYKRRNYVGQSRNVDQEVEYPKRQKTGDKTREWTMA
jgi:hypothetical protein